MKNRSFVIRAILLALGTIVGWIMGGVLTLVWTIFNSLVLGYSDPGSAWVNTVSTVLQITAILTGVVASQWFYHYAHKKGRL